MAALDDEVQVMPGVYLTTFQSTSSARVEEEFGGKSISIKTASGVEVDLDVFDSDNAEILSQEIARLRLSVQKLLESNSLLKEFNAEDPDPEYELAIKENVQVIDKRLRMIKALMQKLAAVSFVPGNSSSSSNSVGASSGPCHAEMAGVDYVPPPTILQQTATTNDILPVQTTEENDDGGVYL
ncbi:UNVERIFIED_CONTAM: hypothetical protein HDU68_007371 [Siphonaria sp. JEL0065]|nr:hypothetical protein HDU68_007371 [Siphonaria sp. JEL0065]